MKDFRESKMDNTISGAIKFSLDYASKQQIFAAAQKWIESDPNILMAVMRGGGGDQEAIDFRYKGEDSSDGFPKSFINGVKDFFSKEVGYDCVVGWDCSSDAYLIK